MPQIKERHKMDIRNLHALVHQGQVKGIPVKTTLAKYKVSDRAYYTHCKRNNLPPWTSKNGTTIMVRKRPKQTNQDLVGGSLRGGNLSKPKKSLATIDEEMAINQKQLKALEKKVGT